MKVETEARTNLETYSNDFTQNWAESSNAADPITQTGTDPWGNANTAWVMVDNGATGTGQVNLGGGGIDTYTASTTYTMSVYAKANGSNFVMLNIKNFTDPANSNVWFNLSTGAVGTMQSGYDTATIEDIGGGWYRCSATFTVLTDTTGNILLHLTDTDNSSNAALDGGSSILIYGFQLEVGDTPSSYIPTGAGATVARAADPLPTIPAAQLDAPGASGDVSFAWDGQFSYADGNTGTADMFELYRWQQGANESLNAQVFYTVANSDDGSVLAQTRTVADGFYSLRESFAQFAPGINVPVKTASRHASVANELNTAVDGVSATAIATGGALPANLASYEIELVVNGRESYIGYIGEFRQWNDDIADAGIAEASDPDREITPTKGIDT
jgi:hypothetical protein